MNDLITNNENNEWNSLFDSNQFSSKNIIFFEIDGILNSIQELKSQRLFKSEKDFLLSQLDKIKVSYLKSLQTYSDCMLILNSNWLNHYDKELILSLLNSYGLRVILSTAFDIEKSSIDSKLETFYEYLDLFPNARWAILDDDIDCYLIRHLSDKQYRNGLILTKDNSLSFNDYKLLVRHFTIKREEYVH